MDGKERAPIYQIVTTADGQTVPVRLDPRMTVTMHVNGQASTAQPIDVSEEEFAHLQHQAHTHHLTVDPHTRRVTATPKVIRQPGH